MTQMALYDRIMLQTKAAFGLPLNPHLFRDCAATSIAIQDPEHVRIAASLLVIGPCPRQEMNRGQHGLGHAIPPACPARHEPR